MQDDNQTAEGDPAMRLRTHDAEIEAGEADVNFWPSADIRAVLDELDAYRDAARYDALMGGPVFRTWDRSALDRARKITEGRR